MINTWTGLCEAWCRWLEQVRYSYWNVQNYLLHRYVYDEVIANAVENNENSTHPTYWDVHVIQKETLKSGHGQTSKNKGHRMAPDNIGGCPASTDYLWSKAVSQPNASALGEIADQTDSPRQVGNDNL